MLVISLLTQAFYSAKSNRAPDIGPYSPRQLRYGRLEVVDATLADNLRNWLARHNKAKTAIQEFMNETFPRQFCWGRTLYRIGEDGYVRDVLYNGYIPRGWSAGGEKEDRYFHAIAPDDPKIIQQLTRLPKSPSYRELADMIGWPYFKSEGTNELRQAILESINRSLFLEEADGRLIINLPYADNFAAHQDVVKALQGWEVPQSLRSLSDKKDKLLENRPQ
ncbi:MAG: hypothetical protein HYS17_09970 [Micavibrio aeruginosavorus]|uniref:Uncharacterized protein n=1 Tax=Micavibrio aeruginosavorus TaxID=349221 RepID=A0A7T5R1I4_9BACT|nr:MAG: hypothetical protein HYS17_09970 [Micavibrio aeruginosavorus]